MSEPALQVTGHMSVHQGIYIVQEPEHLTVVFKELRHGSVFPGERPVLRIASRVMDGPAVKDISTAIARNVFRYTLLVGKAADCDSKALFPC